MSQYIIIGDGYSSSNTNYIEITDGYNSSASNYLIFGQGGNYIPPTPPPPFNPTDLSNLALWLRSDLGITLNGSNVSAWADQSSNGNNFVNASSATQPLYNLNGINSLPSLDTINTVGPSFLACINNTNTFLTGPGATIVYVFHPVAIGSQAGQGLFAQNWGSAGAPSYLPFNGDGNFYDEFYSTTRQVVGAVPITNALSYLVTSSPGNWTAYVNNVQFFTTSTNTVGTLAAAPTIMSGGGAGYWKGFLSEVIVYSRVLTSTERGQVNTYLSSRYGITI
jgi:hypothetical protein